MATKKIDPPQSIGRSLNFTAGRMNALCQQLLEPHKLSLPQWVILSILWREGELTVGALAEVVGNGLPATSRLIDRMVERDLVSKVKAKSDGRASIIRPTKRGTDLSHLSDFHETINARLFKGFSQDERDLSFKLLARMQQNAEEELEKKMID